MPVNEIDDIYLVGKVGRPKDKPKTLGPDTGFSVVSDINWETATVLVNIGSDGQAGGQTMAIQNNFTIGEPLSIAEYVVNSINSRNENGFWHVDVNPITEPREFWKIVSENMGKITDLELEFIAPNIFNSKDETSKGLRRLRDEAHMQKIDVRIKNDQGRLNPDIPPIRDSYEITAQGGGAAKLRSKKKVLYDSKNHAKSVFVEMPQDAVITKDNPGLIRDLIARVFGA